MNQATPPPSGLPLGAELALQQDQGSRRFLLFLLGGSLGLASLLGLASWWIDWTLGIWALVPGIFVLLALLGLWSTRSRIRKLERRLRAFCQEDYLAHWTYSAQEWQAFPWEIKPALPIGEAFIGHEGAYCGGVYLSWNETGRKLLDVVWKNESPPALHFRVLIGYPHGSLSLIYLPVPIPAGKEAEARQVIASLQKATQKKILPLWLKGLYLACICLSIVIVVLQVVKHLGWIR